MAGSMAMWFESHNTDHFNSKPPEAELHFNLWRHPNGPQKDHQFLDIGLLLSDTYELGQLFFYLPIALNSDEIEDLSPKLQSSTMLSAVFNDVVEVGAIKEEFLVARRNGAHYLTVYNISKCGGMDLSEIESENGPGTLIAFKKQISERLRAAGPHYIRFRVKLNHEKAKAFSYQLSGVSVTSSETQTAEFTEIRFNEFRNLPSAVMARVAGEGSRLFRVASAHCFLLRDMKYELVASHSTVHKMRRLEAQLWRGYLPPDLDRWLDNILVYHWKSIAPPNGDVGSFVALAKFKRLDDKLKVYLIGIVLLGAIGSSVASLVAQSWVLGICAGWSRYGLPTVFLIIIFLIFFFIVYHWQSLIELYTRIKGAVPFVGRRAE
jgi:hypothetical protein